MSLYLGNTPICGGIEGNQLNNPFSLLDYKYSEYELSNASWLLSNGQWNSGAVYQSVYDLLLQIYNGTVTKAGVSVKLSTETYADTDFVLNTTNTTFRLPIKVLMAGSKRVAGNGIALGITNGTTNAGLEINSVADDAGVLYNKTANYGETLPHANKGGARLTTGLIGITTDETKSGIETSANGLYLYFYVGETVQDANIIAAGQALTDIADLKNASNFSSLGKETIVGWGMPDYSAEIALSSSSFPYTATTKGYVFIYGAAANTNFNIHVNNTLVVSSQGGSTMNGRSGSVVVDIGDIVTTSSVISASFIPCKE